MAIGRILSRLRPSFMASAATRAHLPPGERGAVRRLLSRLQAQGMAAAVARSQGARACAAARGQKARACAAARLEAIRAEGGPPRAILEFAEARAKAAHAYVISSQQQARPAAFMAALRLRQATDMGIMILLRLVFGVHAPAFKEVLNTLAPAERTFIIMLCVNKVMNELHKIYPQLTLEAVNRLVSTAPESVCPFLGIQSLPFEVCPVEGGLIAVLELVGTSAGIILMFAGGLCVSLCLDIMELLLPNPKLVEYGTKNAESHRADVAAGDVDKDSKIAKAELCVFDVDLVNVDQATLFDLILAANYLGIKDLLDLNCQMVARIIKCKTPEQIRKTFNIKNDFTAEPAAEWAFE